ncbi:MAG: hypothetical protein EOO11_23130, partial [Chitinophagaceae bacterium]
MKKTFTLKGLLMALTVLSCSIASAQSPSTVAPSNNCDIIEDFNSAHGDYRSPSIFTESDYTEFNWDSTAGAWIERSGLATRSASIISCVYINQQPSGGIDIGWRYKACAGGQYRVRLINVACNCVSGYDIVATTANGPVWRDFPADSGRLCIRINDADLYQGQKFRVEISYRGNVPCDWEFDDISLGGDQGAIILPVTFLGITAKKDIAGTRIDWEVADEVNVARYEIERSADGNNFMPIGSVKANGKPGYHFNDATAANLGTAYYRVKNVDIDGHFKYSSVARISGKTSAIVLKAFPLPAANQLTVQHDKMTGGSGNAFSTMAEVLPLMRATELYLK